MIYTNHDFYSNFSAGLKSGDTRVTLDLFVNEISDFIVFDLKNFLNMLEKVGIKAGEKSSDEELVDKTLKALKTNEKITTGLAFLFAEGNGMLMKEKKLTKDQAAALVDRLDEGLQVVTKEIVDSKKVRDDVKERILQQIVSKAEEKGNYTRTIYKKKTKKIVWVLGLAALGTAVFLFIRYRKNEAMKMAQMAAMPPVTLPPPITTPIAAAPIVPMATAVPAIPQATPTPPPVTV